MLNDIKNVLGHYFYTLQIIKWSTTDLRNLKKSLS